MPVVLTDGTLKYVWGDGLAYATNLTGTIRDVYHTDGLGSVRAITDANGNISQTYQTDEFGVPSLAQGTSSQPYRFTGEQRDNESGFEYLRARYYAPMVGRFVSRDSFLGMLPNPLSLDRYNYVTNNPLILVDPSGLSFNQVTNDSAADNQCFSTAGGVFGGDVVNAACLDTPMGGEVIVALVDEPPPPHFVGTIVFAKPPKGGSGQGKDSSRDQMRAAGWTADQIISVFRRGGIRREFPAQYLGSTVAQIERDANDGIQAARKALKLLFDQRFMK